LPYGRGLVIFGCYTCPHSHSPSLTSNPAASGQGLAVAEEKIRKYSDIVLGVDFSPFAIETWRGVWGEHALKLDHHQNRPSRSSCDTNPRLSMFLPQRLSMALAYNVAMMPGVLETFTNNRHDVTPITLIGLQ